MAFQHGVISKSATETVSKPKNRKIFVDDLHINSISVDRKKNPPRKFVQSSDLANDLNFNKSFFSGHFFESR